MIRNIIKIDADKCIGCSLCVNACHEGAIALVDGKATLLRDDYCDGLGNCLPVCPTNAISFEQREAKAYDRTVAPKRIEDKKPSCPGSLSQSLDSNESMLSHWPIQIQLVPSNASYLKNANVVIAADCCAFAYANFNHDFMKDSVTLIGCPKLDELDYSEALLEVFANNDLASITVCRMEVPCCYGIELAASRALEASKKDIPFNVVTFSVDGRIL